MKNIVCIFAIQLLFISHTAVAALYGSIQGSTNTLVELDPATGALLNTIGDIGYRINGMAYDATTDTLYATTSNGDGNFPNGLISIDLSTGIGTEIGTGAGQNVNVPTIDSAGVMYGWTENSDDPVLWDKSAGTITVLGDAGIPSARQSLRFDDSGTLYYVSQSNGIYTIDTTSGLATFVSSITGATGNALHHGDFEPGTTLLYALTETGGGPRDIDVLDIPTATVVRTLTSVPDGLHTLVFASVSEPEPEPEPEPPVEAKPAEPVPALPIYGLVLLIGGMLLVVKRMGLRIKL